MDQIEIIGGNPVSGEIKISGSKNASLPILACSLLTIEPLKLYNVYTYIEQPSNYNKELKI